MTDRNGQRVGYKRVSTLEQSTERQLLNQQLDIIFEDKVSGKDRNRPQLDALIKHVRRGDTVVCHSMDRMARNLGDLLVLVEQLTARGVWVEFVKPPLTFTSEQNSIATLQLQILGAVAQFERDIIKERQREGIEIAKSKGKYKGRKPKLDSEKLAALRVRLATGAPKALIAREFKISRQTLYSVLQEN